MKKISAILGILFIPTISSATPSIGNVSGTLNHGNYITITGSGFGTKSPAKPIMWAPFEAGSISLDASLSSGDGSIKSSTDGFDEISSVDLPHTRSSYALRGMPYSSGIKRNIVVGVNSSYPTTKIFIFNRRKYAHPTFLDGVTNYKFNRVWPSTDTRTNFFLHFTNYGTKYTNSTTEGATSSTEFYEGYVAPNNVWFTEELQVDHGDVDVANASWKYWISGNTYSRSNYVGAKTGTYNGGPQENVWYRWYIQTHWTNDPPPSGAYVYFDDVYMDSTWSRVMIGDASTYDSCTHHEPLIPTAWSDSSIKAYFNQGSFSNGKSVYLFVVDSTGAVSLGKLMTIGGVSAIIGPLPAVDPIPNPPQKLNIN